MQKRKRDDLKINFFSYICIVWEILLLLLPLRLPDSRSSSSVGGEGWSSYYRVCNFLHLCCNCFHVQFATGSSPPPKKKTRDVKKNIAKSFSRVEFRPRTSFFKKMHSLYWHSPLCRISEHAHIFWALSCTFVQGNQIIKFRFASKVLNGENARSVLLLFASPSHRLSAW